MSNISGKRERLNFACINQSALEGIKAVLLRYLPGGKHQGNEYTTLNPTRKDNKLGSFKINTLSGAWADFATGDRGRDCISLVAYIRGISQYSAARELCEMFFSNRVKTGGGDDC